MPTPSSSNDSLNGTALPDPQVPAKATRRQFSTQYKLQILQEVDGPTQLGQTAALLRREGLYSSHLSNWRRQREQGQLAGLRGNKRGRNPQKPDPLFLENQQLQKQVQRLSQQLQQAQLLLDIQKNASEILGLSLNGLDENT